MNEKLKLALEKLNQNDAVLSEVKQNPPKSKEDVIALAKRLGVELSEEDLSISSNLAEEELKKVAGGWECGISHAMTMCDVMFGTSHWGCLMD